MSKTGRMKIARDTRPFRQVCQDSEAWTAIAVAFETPPKRRSLEQRWITSTGLCRAARALAQSVSVLKHYAPKVKRPDEYWFPTRACVFSRFFRDYDFQRAKIARRIAADLHESAAKIDH